MRKNAKGCTNTPRHTPLRNATPRARTSARDVRGFLLQDQKPLLQYESGTTKNKTRKNHIIEKTFRLKSISYKIVSLGGFTQTAI